MSSAPPAQLLLPFDSAAPPEASGRLRQVALADGILSYRLVRAHRRGIAITVGAEGVLARASHQARLAEIEAFLRAKQSWIRRQLAAPRPQPFLWESGAELPWLGASLALVLCGAHCEVRRDGERLEIGVADGASPRARGLAWIAAQALDHFRARVRTLAPRAGIAPPELALSDARTRWGSCSAERRLRLNWRLMLLPPALVDYVVAHELAHCRELNHSARFWETVARLYPDYRSARRELARRARILPEL